MGDVWWWIGHVLGLDDPSGLFYLAWSGIVPSLAVIGGALALVHKHQCHVGRCFRVARYPAGDFVVCRRHHPDVDEAPTAEDVAKHVMTRKLRSITDPPRRRTHD